MKATAARTKDLLWMLSRIADTERQVIPSWTGFNTQTRYSVSTSEDIISYLPTINAPATQMSTVQEILDRSEAIRASLELNDIVIVLDQSLYAKAAEIVWREREKYRHLLLRLRTFSDHHDCTCYCR